MTDKMKKTFRQDKRTALLKVLHEQNEIVLANMYNTFSTTHDKIVRFVPMREVNEWFECFSPRDIIRYTHEVNPDHDWLVVRWEEDYYLSTNTPSEFIDFAELTQQIEEDGFLTGLVYDDAEMLDAVACSVIKTGRLRSVDEFENWFVNNYHDVGSAWFKNVNEIADRFNAWYAEEMKYVAEERKWEKEDKQMEKLER